MWPWCAACMRRWRPGTWPQSRSASTRRPSGICLGRNALSGTHRGWSAIRDDLLAKQGPLSGGTFRAQLLDLAVGSEYIVAIVHATAERAGHRLDQTVCQLMRVRKGKIVEVRGHYADEAALNAFWGPAPGVE